MFELRRSATDVWQITFANAFVFVCVCVCLPFVCVHELPGGLFANTTCLQTFVCVVCLRGAAREPPWTLYLPTPDGLAWLLRRARR